MKYQNKFQNPVASKRFWSLTFAGIIAAANATGFLFNPAYAAVGSNWSNLAAWEKGDSSVGQRSMKNRDLTYTDLAPYAPGSHNLALDVGQVFLMGDLTRFNDSIGSQLHYTYGVSDIFGFDTSLGYSEHAEGKYSMTSFLAGMRMNLSWYDKIIPYAVFGLGFYRPSYQDATAAPSATASSPGNLATVSALLFGIHLGPGIDLELSKNLFFGASLTLHQMFGENKRLSNGSPFFAGGTYTSFLLHAGVSF